MEDSKTFPVLAAFASPLVSVNADVSFFFFFLSEKGEFKDPIEGV